MKKALLLALAGLLMAVVPALAHPPAANVNFASERGVPFGLVLDGRPLTRGLSRQVHVDRLAPGQHWADFTVPTAYGGAVRFRTRVWLEPGLETSFVLLARPGRPLGLRQVDAVALYGSGRGYGGSYGSGRYNSPSPYDRDRYGANDPNGNRNGYASDPNGPAGDYDDEDDSNGGAYPGSATSSYRQLAPQDVDALAQAVQRQPFDADKLLMAKDALSQSSLGADELKRLLQALSFEAARVDLAKFAYSHVADQQNFYRVYDVFNFSSSRQEVQQAVGLNSSR